jgi:hypothetical protein
MHYITYKMTYSYPVTYRITTPRKMYPQNKIKPQAPPQKEENSIDW